MIPDHGATFVVRFETNEMIERERFAALLAEIETELRKQDFGGPGAILLVGPVRHGSIEVVLGIVGAAAGAASMILAIPGFLVALKQLAGDSRRDPNDFAVAIGEVMALDGAARVDLIHKDKVVTIRKDEVPFVQQIAFGMPSEAQGMPLPRPDQVEDGTGAFAVEDEDQDWVETIEAGDHPPREAAANPSGHVSALTLIGEFENIERQDGTNEVRFVPRDTIFAPYFVVTSRSYDAEPMELVHYEVTGNVTLDGEGGATIEVLSIAPPGDAFLKLRT